MNIMIYLLSVLFLFTLLSSMVNADSFSSRYGFDTHGYQGAAIVHVGGHDHGFGYNLKQHHKDGSSYIHQSANYVPFNHKSFPQHIGRYNFPHNNYGFRHFGFGGHFG